MPRSRSSANYEITASDRTRAGVASATNSLRSLDSVAARLGVSFSLLSAAGAAAPGLIISANAPLIDQMGKLATQTGASVEFIQAYRREAALAGIESGTFDKAIEKMARRIAEASVGLGEARGSLDELGLSAVDLSQLNIEEQFNQISTAIEGLANQGDRARIASKVFDVEGVSLIRASAEGIQDAKEQMIGLGIALDEADVRGVEAMNDAMFLLQNSTSQAAQIFTAQMAPAITGVITQIFGAQDSMSGLRDTSLTAADVFVGVVGAIGNSVEGLDNVFDSVGIGLQFLNVQAAKVTDFLDDSEESARALADAADNLQQLQDNLAGQTGDATFWTQLEGQVESAREAARQAAKESDDIRARLAANVGIDIQLPTLTTSTAAPTDTAFQSLIESLATGTEQVELEYAKRLNVIDEFQQAFPQRGDEALQAQIAALEAYDAALDKLRSDRQDGQDQASQTTLAPLESNLNAVVASLETETEAIVAEYANRAALLAELGDFDVDRKAEVDELLIQLAEKTTSRLEGIERASASRRKSIQADFASSALGIASSLIDSLGGESERSKRIAARAAQAEALVAGISAAERARNHASLTGGVISGGLAAGLSWAATLANVAGIEASLNGGTPAGPSGSGGVSEGATSDIAENLESGANEAAPINITFVLDETTFNRRAIEDMSVSAVAKATQSRDLTYNTSRDYYESNSEASV